MNSESLNQFIGFYKTCWERLLLFKRIVNNSKLNFNLHLIIILTFTNDGKITLGVGLSNLKINEINQKSIFCPLTEKKLKRVFGQLDESQADKVLVYFTHFPL